MKKLYKVFDKLLIRYVDTETWLINVRLCHYCSRFSLEVKDLQPDHNRVFAVLYSSSYMNKHVW